MVKLTVLYRVGFAASESTTAYYISNQLDLTEDDRKALRDADCIAWQVVDGATNVVRPSAIMRRGEGAAGLGDVPMAFCRSPASAQQRLPYAENGPFDPELGDVFLNGLISQGVSAEDAVGRYLSLDFSTRTDLDRLFELWFNGQRRRDSACGFEIADFVAQSFRTEQVFLTPHHPNLPVFQSLARQLFHRIGCEPARTENVLAGLWRSPFAPGCLPIIPRLHDTSICNG
jgi:Polysaccharide biosynthesis enzyme WcbI